MLLRLIRLVKKINIQTLIDNLKTRNVLVRSNLVSYYEQNHYDNSIRLSISMVTAEELAQALDTIYEEIGRASI